MRKSQGLLVRYSVPRPEEGQRDHCKLARFILCVCVCVCFWAHAKRVSYSVWLTSLIAVRVVDHFLLPRSGLASSSGFFVSEN